MTRDSREGSAGVEIVVVGIEGREIERERTVYVFLLDDKHLLLHGIVNDYFFGVCCLGLKSRHFESSVCCLIVLMDRKLIDGIETTEEVSYVLSLGKIVCHVPR